MENFAFFIKYFWNKLIIEVAWPKELTFNKLCEELVDRINPHPYCPFLVPRSLLRWRALRKTLYFEISHTTTCKNSPCLPYLSEKMTEYSERAISRFSDKVSPVATRSGNVEYSVSLTCRFVDVFQGDERHGDSLDSLFPSSSQWNEACMRRHSSKCSVMRWDCSSISRDAPMKLRRIFGVAG